MMISTLQCAIDCLFQLPLTLRDTLRIQKTIQVRITTRSPPRYLQTVPVLFAGIRRCFVNEDTQAQAQRSGKQHANHITLIHRPRWVRLR